MLVPVELRERHMKTSFNIAERGNGSYWPLAILRWVMVVIFISFGMQKFTLQSAQGIAQYISNSPFVWWLSVFGLRGEAYLLGVIELFTAALLAAGAVGFVTTHDLSLAAIAERLPGAINVHFCDGFAGGELQFDYTMRPGIVPHGNGLALMRAVGLEV